MLGRVTEPGKRCGREALAERVDQSWKSQPSVSNADNAYFSRFIFFFQIICYCYRKRQITAFLAITK